MSSDVSAAPVTTSALAPFARRAFFWLWLGVLIAGLATWMQTVGAQWLLVQQPNATIVALVQAANSLPMMLLALPAGVMADVFDRRWMLFIIQVYLVLLAIGLAVLTATGNISAVTVLLFTVAWGAGVALQLPAWQSLIPELVQREHVRSAVRLDMVSVNVARAAGPALAGFIIARWGVPQVFAAGAVLILPLMGVLLMWRRPAARTTARETFIGALRAGGRYVRHEPIVLRIFVRCFLFVLGGSAMWALLPLVASQRLGVGPTGYGVMFTAVGIGAVVGAFGLAGVKDALSTNAMMAVSTLVYAASLAGLVLLPGYWLVLVALVFAGLSWMGAVSTLNGDVALVLPTWVRARGMALNMVMFTGATVIGSIVWGQVTDRFSLRTALLAAAALLLLTIVAGFWLRMPDVEGFDPAPAYYWNEVDVAIEVDPSAGPVAVQLEYSVALDRQTEFLAAMDDMRRSRLRTGAIRWELFRDGAVPTRFVETFTISTWGEHLKQHEVRMTALDEAVETRALAFSDPPVRSSHLLPPGTGAPTMVDLPE